MMELLACGLALTALLMELRVARSNFCAGLAVLLPKCLVSLSPQLLLLVVFDR